jgi:hypothetical protein
MLCCQPYQDELAKSVTTEQGKTFQDAKGDVFRGLGEQQGRTQGGAWHGDLRSCLCELTAWGGAGQGRTGQAES